MLKKILVFAVLCLFLIGSVFSSETRILVDGRTFILEGNIWTEESKGAGGRTIVTKKYTQEEVIDEVIDEANGFLNIGESDITVEIYNAEGDLTKTEKFEYTSSTPSERNKAFPEFKKAIESINSNIDKQKEEIDKVGSSIKNSQTIATIASSNGDSEEKDQTEVKEKEIAFENCANNEKNCPKGYTSKEGKVYLTSLTQFEIYEEVSLEKFISSPEINTPTYEEVSNLYSNPDLKGLSLDQIKKSEDLNVKAAWASVNQKSLDEVDLSYSSLDSQTQLFLASKGDEKALESYLNSNQDSTILEFYSKSNDQILRQNSLKKLIEIDNSCTGNECKKDSLLSQLCSGDNSNRCIQDLSKSDEGLEYMKETFSTQKLNEAFKNFDEKTQTELVLVNLDKKSYDELCKDNKERCQEILLKETLNSNSKTQEKARSKIEELVLEGDIELSEAEAADVVFTYGTLEEQEKFAEIYNDGTDCSAFIGSLMCTFTGEKNARQLEEIALQRNLDYVSNSYKTINYPSSFKDDEKACDDDETVNKCDSRLFGEDGKSGECNQEEKPNYCENARKQIDLYSSYGFKDNDDKSTETINQVNREYKKAALSSFNIENELKNREEQLNSILNKNNLRINEIDAEILELENVDPDLWEPTDLGETLDDYVERLKEEREQLVESNGFNSGKSVEIKNNPFNKDKEDQKILNACLELTENCINVIDNSAYCVDQQICKKVKERIIQADKNKPVRTNLAYSIIDAIKNPDQSGLKAAKVFGFETNYENVPEILRESFPSQLCLDKIDGYLDKEVENNGGVTKYDCDEYDVRNNPSNRCVDVQGDLRAQRSAITPDNKTLVTYSYYVKNPSNPFELSVKYVQNGNWKIFILENSSNSKNMDSVQIPLNDTQGIDPNSFTINLNTADLSLTYPIILVSSQALKDTIENNGNSQGNHAASYNSNLNGQN